MLTKKKSLWYERRLRISTKCVVHCVFIHKYLSAQKKNLEGLISLRYIYDKFLEYVPHLEVKSDSLEIINILNKDSKRSNNAKNILFLALQVNVLRFSFCNKTCNKVVHALTTAEARLSHNIFCSVSFLIEEIKEIFFVWTFLE